MARRTANARRSQTRWTQPGLEGLEYRRLLSNDALHRSIAAVASSNGAFSHGNREFTYTTPTGGLAVTGSLLVIAGSARALAGRPCRGRHAHRVCRRATASAPCRGQGAGGGVSGPHPGGTGGPHARTYARHSGPRNVTAVSSSWPSRPLRRDNGRSPKNVLGRQDGGALARKGDGAGAADPGCCRGHECALALQAACHLILLTT